MIVVVPLFSKGMCVPVLVDLEGVTFQQAAMIKPVKSIAEPGKKVPVMGDEKKGLIETGENIQQAMATVMVEIVGGFIHEQDGGLHGQDRGQSDQTFLSPGKLMGDAVFVSV